MSPSTKRILRRERLNRLHRSLEKRAIRLGEDLEKLLAMRKKLSLKQRPLASLPKKNS
jgi:hypothetical protein